MKIFFKLYTNPERHKLGTVGTTGTRPKKSKRAQIDKNVDRDHKFFLKKIEIVKSYFKST